jgi:hypothetical protein
MAVTAALLFLLGSLAGEAGKDSVADLLGERCLSLGIDLDPDNPNASHPAPADVQALARAGAGSWLDAQITSGDDVITEPPEALWEFLRAQQGPLQAAIAILEKRSPEPAVKAGSLEVPKLLPIVRLEKLLLAAALVEARSGDALEAERALEASWSLGKAFASGHYLISQLLSVSVERWQSGVLRKLPEVPLAWINRLSTDSAWTRMLDAVAEEGTLLSDPKRVSTEDTSPALRRRALAALADGLRKVSACELPGLSDEEIFRPAADVFRLETSQQARAWGEIYKDMVMPNFLSSIRRAARLMVDRELTLKVLELRFEKAASREGAWPTEYENLGSSVCPGVLYAYGSDGKSMQIRFDGPVNTPEAGVVLPLEFRSGAGLAAPLPTLTPSPTPTPTPTPEPEPGELDSPNEPEP